MVLAFLESLLAFALLVDIGLKFLFQELTSELVLSKFGQARCHDCLPSDFERHAVDLSCVRLVRSFFFFDGPVLLNQFFFQLLD